MGGYGSGRTGWKPKAETAKRVDIRYLYKRGMLIPGSQSTLSWNLGGEPAGNIRMKAEEGEIILIYRIRLYGEEEWHSIEEPVSLTWTDCNFGGQRPWFRCPKCNKGVAVLYGLGRYFLCRHCYGVTYYSRCEGWYDRLLRKDRKICRQLNSDGNDDTPDGFKPKGMHCKTYDRLCREREKLGAGMARYVEKIFGVRFW